MPTALSFTRAFWLVLLTAASAAAQVRVPEIVPVRGDVYLVRAGSTNTVFYVTPEGIVLGDPVGIDTARWLRDELARRFGTQVRHIVYSHHDVDHVRGAEAFPGATIWAQENFRGHYERPWRRLGERVDANGDGRLETAEAASGGLFPTYFARFDQDRDGALTPAELNAGIVPAGRTFTEKQTLTLGGRTIELVSAGRNHSDDGTVLVFPAERVAFGVDFANPGVTPDIAPNFDGVPMSDWVSSLSALERLDIDLFVPGHGPVGTKADLERNRRFFEELAAAVQQGLAEGRDLPEITKAVTMSAYGAWPGFEAARPGLVAAAAENLKTWPDQFRTEVLVTVIGSVRKGGLFRVPKGTTIRQVLERAGGGDERADLKAVRLMRIVGFDRREYDVTLDDLFLHNDTIIVPRVP